MLEVLQIENTNYCNARCIFCVYDQIEKHGTMSEKLYTKILRDAMKLDPPPKTFPHAHRRAFPRPTDGGED